MQTEQFPLLLSSFYPLPFPPGIHLLRTGQIEANLLTLNEDAKLPQLPDLIARKLAGPEQSTLPNADLPFHTAEIQRLTTQLEQARDQTTLPESPTAQPALHNLLTRLRLNTQNQMNNE